MSQTMDPAAFGSSISAAGCLEGLPGGASVGLVLDADLREIASQSFQSVALPVDLGRCAEPKSPEDGDGRAPALKCMWQQEPGDGRRQGEKSAIDRGSQDRADQ